MKSVLISIQPKWCELIASGKKTVEVRKSRPKLDVPFKVYIYCTKNTFDIRYSDSAKDWQKNACGKVIGEFVCDWLCEWYPHHIKTLFRSKYGYFVLVDDLESSCLTYEELANYGNGKTMYGWHISNLVIYDKPRELSEFYNWKKCNSCRTSGYESTACMYDEDCKVPAIITKPPQSWCYVEGEK
jgi:predicted transcriptional regulator